MIVEKIKTPLLIGVTGYKDSGKDTFAKIIKDFVGDPPPIGHNWLIPSKDKVHFHAFGDALKRVCSIMYDIPVEYFFDREKKEQEVLTYPYCKVREIMTGVGTDAIRKRFPDTWVEKTKRDVIKSMQVYQAPVTIVTDVRYPDNEADLIRELGGVIVRVNNTQVGLNSDHSSETKIDEIRCDYGVSNPMDATFWTNTRELFKVIVNDHNARAKEPVE